MLETRAIRAKRQQELAELKLLERMGKGVWCYVRSVNRRCCDVWQPVSSYKQVFQKVSQELDLIEDMVESIGMVASRRGGRRSR